MQTRVDGFMYGSKLQCIHVCIYTVLSSLETEVRDMRNIGPELLNHIQWS